MNDPALASPSNTSTPISDEKGRRPLEELLSENEELRRQYEESFTKLPAIERLTELWAAREGLGKDDPIFVIAEMLGLFEIRSRSAMRGLVGLMQQQDEIIASQVAEMEEQAAANADLKKALGEARAVVDTLRKDEKNLCEINTQFLEVIPDVMESIHGAAKLINDKSWKAILLTWGGMVAAMGGGVLIGVLLRSLH